jgi:hypothetical protein
MGLFDFFKGDKVGGLQKTSEKWTNKHMQTQDRMAILEQLLKDPDDEKIGIVLKRFDVILDNTTIDADEKNYTKSRLVELGLDSERSINIAGPVQKWIRTKTSVSYPIKILVDLIGKKETEAWLLGELERTEASPDWSNDRKIKLIIELRDFDSQATRDCIANYIHDEEEDVRLIALGVYDHIEGDHRELLIKILQNNDQSARVKSKCLELWIHHGWELGSFEPQLKSVLPHGFEIKSQKLQRTGA